MPACSPRTSALLSVLGIRLKFSLGTGPARPLPGLAGATAMLSGDAAVLIC